MYAVRAALPLWTTRCRSPRPACGVVEPWRSSRTRTQRAPPPPGTAPAPHGAATPDGHGPRQTAGRRQRHTTHATRARDATADTRPPRDAQPTADARWTVPCRACAERAGSCSLHLPCSRRAAYRSLWVGGSYAPAPACALAAAGCAAPTRDGRATRRGCRVTSRAREVPCPTCRAPTWPWRRDARGREALFFSFSGYLSRLRLGLVWHWARLPRLVGILQL